jgi:hypothetical protein
MLRLCVVVVVGHNPNEIGESAATGIGREWEYELPRTLRRTPHGTLAVLKQGQGPMRRGIKLVRLKRSIEPLSPAISPISLLLTWLKRREGGRREIVHTYTSTIPRQQENARVHARACSHTNQHARHERALTHVCVRTHIQPRACKHTGAPPCVCVAHSQSVRACGRTRACVYGCVCW